MGMAKTKKAGNHWFRLTMIWRKEEDKNRRNMFIKFEGARLVSKSRQQIGLSVLGVRAVMERLLVLLKARDGGTTKKGNNPFK